MLYPQVTLSEASVISELTTSITTITTVGETISVELVTIQTSFKELTGAEVANCASVMDELVVVVVVVGHRDADRGGWWTSTKARSWRGSHRIQEGQTHNFQVLHFSNMHFI